jgi:hypothetical protein
MRAVVALAAVVLAAVQLLETTRVVEALAAVGP